MFAHVTFTHLVVDTTADALSDAQLASQAFFRLEVGDETFPDASVDILHPNGAALESGLFDALEVSDVHGSYRGKWNAPAFTGHVERYVRDVIESQGYHLGLTAAANTSVVECLSEQRECWFEIPD